VSKNIVPDCVDCKDGFQSICNKRLYDIENIRSIYQIIDLVLSHIFINAKDYHDLNNALFVSKKERDQIKSSYNILHPLKHRVGGLLFTLTQLKELYDKSPSSEMTKNAISICVDDAHSVAKFANLAYFSYYSSIHEKEDIYSIYRFSRSSNLDFSWLVFSVFDKVKNSNRYDGFEYVLELTESFIIEPYFHFGDKPATRLYDDIYEAILFEIIANFMNHGADSDNVKKLSVGSEKKLGSVSIVFKNKLDTINNNKPIRKFAGGLQFIDQTLENTSAGVAAYSHENGYYKVSLNLKGLK